MAIEELVTGRTSQFLAGRPHFLEQVYPQNLWLYFQKSEEVDEEEVLARAVVQEGAASEVDCDLGLVACALIPEVVGVQEKLFASLAVLDQLVGSGRHVTEVLDGHLL